MANLPFLGTETPTRNSKAIPVTFVMPEVPNLELTQLQQQASAAGTRVDIFLSTTPRQMNSTDVIGKTIREIYDTAHGATTNLPPAFLVFDGTSNTSKVVDVNYRIQEEDNVVQIKSTSDAALLA